MKLPLSCAIGTILFDLYIVKTEVIRWNGLFSKDYKVLQGYQ